MRPMTVVNCKNADDDYHAEQAVVVVSDFCGSICNNLMELSSAQRESTQSSHLESDGFNNSSLQ